MKHEEMEGTKGTTLSKHVWSLKRASPTPSPGPFRKGGGGYNPSSKQCRLSAKIGTSSSCGRRPGPPSTRGWRSSPAADIRASLVLDSKVEESD